MKLSFLLAAVAGLCVAFTIPRWQNDFDEARKEAAAEHKYILLNFSGSDWCVPCIRMHSEIFNSSIFSAYANEKLVLVNADFPRLKKNRLSAARQKQNDALAERYNSSGNFPCTVLLSAEGGVLKRWDGLPKGDAASFTEEIKQVVNGNN